MKFLNKIKRIQVHRENSLNQPTDLAEEAKIILHVPMKRFALASFIILLMGNVQAEPVPISNLDAGTVTNICGRRVVLSYRMPIPNNKPNPDVVTRCYVEEYDQKQERDKFYINPRAVYFTNA